MFHTRIVCTSPDENAAVFMLGRSCVVENLAICFSEELLTGKESRGQRVGILTGNGRSMLQRGSSIRNVRIDNVGTGIYSAGENSSESFSVTYDTLEIYNFTYRGVDFCALNRTGNVFRNLYIMSKYRVDTLFALETEESETSITQLNIEHTHCRYGVRLVGVRAFDIATIHFEGIFLDDPEGAMLYISRSAGTISAMSVYYCGITAPGCCMVELGDTDYDLLHEWAPVMPDMIKDVRISTLHLKGLNDPNFAIHKVCYNGLLEPAAAGFAFFRQEKGVEKRYRVQIEQYIYYTFKQDHAIYESIPREGNIEFVELGKLPISGPSALRPMHRLCPYRTQYFDTDLNRMLLWNGTDWQ